MIRNTEATRCKVENCTLGGHCNQPHRLTDRKRRSNDQHPHAIINRYKIDLLLLSYLYAQLSHCHKSQNSKDCERASSLWWRLYSRISFNPHGRTEKVWFWSLGPHDSGSWEWGTEENIRLYRHGGGIKVLHFPWYTCKMINSSMQCFLFLLEKSILVICQTQ